VVVKFGWRVESGEANNFVLTAYLIEKWCGDESDSL
jgi:hypothetical protein